VVPPAPGEIRAIPPPTAESAPPASLPAPPAIAAPAAPPARPPAIVAIPTAPPLVETPGRAGGRWPAAVTPSPAPAAPAPGEEAVAGLRLEVFVYGDRPADRFVFINAKKYVEGQQVEGKYLLEAITPQGAVLRHEGRQILLRP
jgi:general secretion pathway protein B